MMRKYPSAATLARFALCATAAVFVACDSSTDPGPQPASIGVSPNPLVLKQLGSQQLVPIVYDADGALISGVTVSFSSVDESMATVTPGGLVQSVGPAGNTSITLKAGAATTTLPVSITAVRSSISVTPNPITLPQKTTLAVQARVIDAIGATVPGAALTYTSADPTLFTVSASGVITSVGPAGLANLIIDHDTLSTLVPVAVTQVPTTLRVSTQSLVLGVGGQALLGATVLDAAGAPVVGAAITYSSSNTSRVTVSNAGLVRSVGGTGPATITVASSGLSATVAVDVVDVGRPVGTIASNPAVSGWPWGIGISSLDVVYVTAPGDGSVMASPVSNPAFVTALSGIPLPLSVAFSASGATAYVSIDNGVKIIDVASSSTLNTVTGFTGNTVFSVALSPDGQTLAIGTAASLHFMNVQTQAITYSATTPGGVNALVFTPDGTRVYASQFTNGLVDEYSVTSKSHLRAISAPGIPQGVGISPDGTTLYVAKEGTTDALEIIDLTNGARQSVPLGVGCFGLALTPDRTEVWLACHGGVYAVDRGTRTVRTTVATGGFNRRIAFSTDGLTAVVTNDDGRVYFIK